MAIVHSFQLSVSKALHPPPMRKHLTATLRKSRSSPKSNSPPVQKRVNSSTALGSRGIVSSVRSMFANESANVPRGALRFYSSGSLLNPHRAATDADLARSSQENKGHTTERSPTPPLPSPSVETPIKKPSFHVSLWLKQLSSLLQHFQFPEVRCASELYQDRCTTQKYRKRRRAALQLTAAVLARG